MSGRSCLVRLRASTMIGLEHMHASATICAGEVPPTPTCWLGFATSPARAAICVGSTRTTDLRADERARVVPREGEAARRSTFDTPGAPRAGGARVQARAARRRSPRPPPAASGSCHPAPCHVAASRQRYPYCRAACPQRRLRTQDGDLPSRRPMTCRCRRLARAASAASTSCATSKSAARPRKAEAAAAALAASPAMAMPRAGARARLCHPWGSGFGTRTT
eukprot:scaffold58308_cov68-Phaeocystis_antarctica.AAC.2